MYSLRMGHRIQSTCINVIIRAGLLRSTEHGVINACFSLQVRNRLTLIQRTR